MLRAFLLLFFAVHPQKARAEYRVFELLIGNPQTKEQRIIRSTLDPFQYPGYYEIRNGESVLYQATWMCWGDTSYMTKLCDNPKASSESPAKK